MVQMQSTKNQSNGAERKTNCTFGSTMMCHGMLSRQGDGGMGMSMLGLVLTYVRYD